MSSPPVYHEVLTPKKGIKEVKEGIPRSPLVKSPARDSPLLSASVPVATLRKASPKRPAGSLNYLDSLRALPEVRPIPWMPGKELPPDKSTESPRTQTKSAFLLSTRGKINDPPCNHCTSGVGRFLHCITLEGWFHGACATCQMGTRGNLCSLRSDGGGDKSKQQLTGPSPTDIQFLTSQSTNESTPQASEPKKVITSNPKRKRESLKNDPLPTNITMASAHFAATTSAGPPAGPLSYNSPYATIPSTQPNQQPSPHPVYHGHKMGTNYNYTDPSMVNYIYKRPPVPNEAPKSFQGENLTWIRPAPSATKATELQHHWSPTDQLERQHTSHPANRDESTSLSPSEQLLASAHPPPVQAPPVQHSNVQQQAQQRPFQHQSLQHAHAQANGQVNSTVQKTESLPSLLDSLPKKKQKLIHGLVKNLQDGIKRAQQDADNMQQQLDLLQAALGMNGPVDVVD